MPSPVRWPRLAGLLLSSAVAWWAAPLTAQPPPTASSARSDANAPYLSLAEALIRATTADPGVGAAAARLAAAEAAVRQAGVKPNASLSADIENFVGSGPFARLNRTETTLSYERPIERGDKRDARIGQARAETQVVRLRADVKRLDLLRNVELAYAEALAAEADLLVAEARLISAQRLQVDISRRVRSARDPLFAGSRAEALTAQAEIARDRAREAARTSKALLASFWGGSPEFTLKLDDFFNVTPPTDLPEAAGPDLALLEAEREVAVAAVRAAQSRSVADPTLRGGLRHFGDGSNVALVVGGSIPLGVAATNRASIDRARAEQSAAEQDVLTAKIVRDREIVRLIVRLRALATEAERIRAEVIPHAIRTVEQVTDGFNRGGFSYIDVTEAERALADARARRVEVLRDFHTATAELDRLAGKHRNLLNPSVEERR